MLTRVSCRSGRIATAATAAALRSRIAAAPLALRALHHASAALNTINQSSNVRTAGPMRVEQWMQKRLEDVKHEQESAASRPTVFASEAAFINELDRLYSRLRAGLADMLESNHDAGMSFNLNAAHQLEVGLGPTRGSFMFTPDMAAHRLNMFTPVSAASYIYRFDFDTNFWIADSDQHILDELFVREIIRTDLQGWPQL